MLLGVEVLVMKVLEDALGVLLEPSRFLFLFNFCGACSSFPNILERVVPAYFMTHSYRVGKSTEATLRRFITRWSNLGLAKS